MEQKRNENIFFEFLNKRKDFINIDSFVDPSSFTWTALVKENYVNIKDEVINFYIKNKEDFNPYFNNELMNLPDKWRSYGFYFWGIKANQIICNEFAHTIQILKHVQGIVSASISIMEPKSEIKPHYGDTNAIYRCHFGLVIPSGLPTTGFQVKYDQRAWQQGEFLIFNDSAYHKGWNYSEQQRIILIIDVIRPEYMHQKLWICARVHAIITSQKIIKKYPKLELFIKLNSVQWLLLIFNLYYMAIIKRKYLWL